MAHLRPIASARPRLTTASTLTLSGRSFSTSSPRSRQTPTHLKVPAEQVPEYPYGPFRWYKQANSGLYGGARIRFGNTVSKKHNVKAPAQWRPNRQMKRLWSPALNMFIRTRLTTQILKTVDKLGGIDNYLLGNKARRIKELGPAGWRLRWKVMQSPMVQERWASERAALGLPPKEARTTGSEDVLGEQPTSEEMAALDGMLEREEVIALGEEETPSERAESAAAAIERDDIASGESQLEKETEAQSAQPTHTEELKHKPNAISESVRKLKQRAGYIMGKKDE